MAVIQMAKILQPLNEYSENLLNYNSTFDNDVDFSLTSGYGTCGIDTNHYFQGGKSLRAVNFDSIPMSFFANQELGFTAPQTGVYILSLRLFIEDANGDDPSFVVNVFRNGILSNTYTCLYMEEPTFNSWCLYAQTMNFIEGEEISLSFEFNPAFVNDSIWIDGMKCEFDDKNLGLPTAWSMPKGYCSIKTGWVDTTDTVNSQSLTANTDNLIQIATPQDENGGLTLLDSNAKITPTKLNDSIVVDFAFSFSTPSGTSNYLNVYLKVNGIIYRAYTHAMLKSSGVTDYVSVSFNLPVKTDFFNNGAEFYVNPSTNISITNRYIQVTKIHNGI